ncbi:MAG: excinuclease ABC subunit UvrC [Pseudomonadota bacterium]|nr:excinuclease ABC subunit UvrC [Pseudomonadota bacterium]
MADAPPPSFDGKSFARELTAAPGVYRMLGADGQVLYVGKAKSLRKRVGTYFNRPQLEPRIALMLTQVQAMEVIVTRTESEALILENELIKSLKPYFNVLLRDSKGYPYLHLDEAHAFPRIRFHRGARDGKGRYFGPFPSVIAVRENLARIHKLFQLRQCEDSVFNNRSRPCLQYQIKRCSAPCVGLIESEVYAADVRHAVMFLQGRTEEVVAELTRQMEVASAALEFERAAAWRDEIGRIRQLQARQFVSGGERDADILACVVQDGLACVQALFYRDNMNLGSRHWFLKASGSSEAAVLEAFVTQHYAELPVPSVVLLSHELDDAELFAEALSQRAEHRVEIFKPQRGDRVRLVEQALRNAQITLASQLRGEAVQRHRWQALTELLELDEPPQRIECFDVSHTMGEDTVASCVVAGPDGPMKSLYRRFNIKGITAGDDYAAMRQVIERRFRRLQNEQAELPDVLLIDGGMGQVSKAMDALGELGVTGMQVIGVSKGRDRRAGWEELVFAETGRVLRPGSDSAGLLAIQAIRDEAHRFAISGHRAKREKTRQVSTLEEIAGVGARRRAALLKHFGGLAGVRGAGVEELCNVGGINRSLAERIYASLHE